MGWGNGCKDLDGWWCVGVVSLSAWELVLVFLSLERAFLECW
jgi:hypothetical protein